MPCVASNTGGTPDMLQHKKEGFLYSYTEPAVLAHYISSYFDDNDLAVKSGENAKSHASNTHNKRKNIEDLIKIYNNL